MFFSRIAFSSIAVLFFVTCSSLACSSRSSSTGAASDPAGAVDASAGVTPSEPPRIEGRDAVIVEWGSLEVDGGPFPTLDVVIGDAPALCTPTPVRTGDKLVRLELAGDKTGIAPGTYRPSGTADWGPGRVFGYLHQVDERCAPDGSGAAMLPESTIELLTISRGEVRLRVHVVLGIGGGVLDGEFTARRCGVWSAMDTPDGYDAAIAACENAR